MIVLFIKYRKDKTHKKKKCSHSELANFIGHLLVIFKLSAGPSNSRCMFSKLHNWLAI